MSHQSWDVVLFGATGFTGRLVAEYMARHAPPEARVALAGRDLKKLQEVQAGLPERGRQWSLVVADAGDSGALKQLAEKTRVVCTTVGPYAKYGLPLVEACALAGTHLCDLTGEVPFMRASIDGFHQRAKASGARIVHTCGFDSIPSDLGVLALHEVLGPMRRATYVLETAKGGFSGGTVASLLNIIDEAKKDRSLRRLLADPYALSPNRTDEPRLDSERDLAAARFDDFVNQWTAPFVMASVNTRVVRRSNALAGYPYGKHFRYAEVMGFKHGLKAMLKAVAVTSGVGLVVGSLMLKPTRAIVGKWLPQAGEGPDEQTRQNGFLKVRIFGESEAGVRRTALIQGTGDPGYQLTSLLLGESALCLAFDEALLPKVAGVLTPATAMGRVLINRLTAAGMKFVIE